MAQMEVPCEREQLLTDWYAKIKTKTLIRYSDAIFQMAYIVHSDIHIFIRSL